MLEDRDNIHQLLASMTDAIRKALQDGAQDYMAALDRGVAELKSAPEFQPLSAQVWDEVLEKCSLRPLPELKLGTEAEVIAAAEATPLSTLPDRLDALKGRLDRARKLLAEAVAPKAVSYRPPQRLVTTAEEVESYVTEIREALMKAIGDGNPVNIGR